MDIVKSGQLGSERSAGETRTKRPFKLASHGAARNGSEKPQLHLAQAAVGRPRIAQAVAIWGTTPSSHFSEGQAEVGGFPSTAESGSRG